MLCSGVDHHLREMGRLEMQRANLMRDQASTIYCTVGVNPRDAYSLNPKPLTRRVALRWAIQDVYNAIAEAICSAPACELK